MFTQQFFKIDKGALVLKCLLLLGKYKFIILSTYVMFKLFSNQYNKNGTGSPHITQLLFFFYEKLCTKLKFLQSEQNKN